MAIRYGSVHDAWRTLETLMSIKTVTSLTAYLWLNMGKKFPLHPANPHRICWGCDKYCPADAMTCGNGSVRAPHPAELFGEDWYKWGPKALPEATHPVS